MSDPFLVAILFACGLLLVGFALRAWLRPLAVLYVPASVVGGFLGFALVQTGLRLGPAGLNDATAAVAGSLSGWPGTLIAVVFAGLLLERSGKSFKDAAAGAARQGVVVWIIVLGEIAIGIGLTWLLVRPFYDVPPGFGQLIETGFAGGHGTAGAMGVLYRDALHFPAGRDLAFFFATVGLIWGVVSGIGFVNLGVRRGWLTRRSPADSPDARPASDTLNYERQTEPRRIPVITGLEDRADPPPAAFAVVRGEVIDPLLFQACILTAAFGVGWLLQLGFVGAAGRVLSDQTMRFLGNVPLFLFTLIGGLIVREVMHGLGVGDLIDPHSIRRLVAAAMELLIVAAIATLRVEALVAYFWPVLLLCVAGSAWCAFCLLVVCRRLLPKEYWFELGLINYGMSTATTAQGMLLLRIVDPDLESGAAEDYAAAAPLSAPFVGGGILTFTLPLLLQRVGAGWVALILVAAVGGLYVLGAKLAARG